MQPIFRVFILFPHAAKSFDENSHIHHAQLNHFFIFLIVPFPNHKFMLDFKDSPLNIVITSLSKILSNSMKLYDKQIIFQTIVE